jgi:hypothetical protein
MGYSKIINYFCCKEFDFHINEMEQIIVYLPADRSYLIKVNDSVGQEIKYCPWCGNKLPDNLVELRSSIIFDQLKLDGYDDPNLPPEFRTDEWWKKRGL